MPQRYFLDTEFVEDGETIMPISLALVREDGRELYIEFKFDEEKAVAHDFVREHVLPHLAGQEQYTREEAARRITHFLGLGPLHPAESKPDVEIWAFFAAYDWVIFCQVFGTFMDLPEGCPRFCRDLMQWWSQLGYPDGVKPPQPMKAHHALADADWNHQFHKNLERYECGEVELDGPQTEQFLEHFRKLNETSSARARSLVEEWEERVRALGMDLPLPHADLAQYALALRTTLVRRSR